MIDENEVKKIAAYLQWCNNHITAREQLKNMLAAINHDEQHTIEISIQTNGPCGRIHLREIDAPEVFASLRDHLRGAINRATQAVNDELASTGFKIEIK